jgi:hypothetical protein
MRQLVLLRCFELAKVDLLPHGREESQGLELKRVSSAPID